MTGVTAAAVAAPHGPGNGPHWPAQLAGRCRIPDCPAPVGERRLMCRRHWYQVPKQLRDAIWATWRSGAGIFDHAYRQVVHEAVAAVLNGTTGKEGPL